MKPPKYLLSIVVTFIFLRAFSQQASFGINQEATGKAPAASVVDSARQKDIIDVIQKLFNKTISPEFRKIPKKAIFSVIPYAGYTLSTGYTADISGNVGFFTSKSHDENFSVITADLGYDTKSQKIFFTRSEIWSAENNFKLVSDLRLERYPTDTYGLGTATTFATINDITFNYLRIYETLLKKIVPDYYAGIGYNLDYHYNIIASGNQNNTVSDFEKYGQFNHSASSGVNLDFLIDSRKNPLNPMQGVYANVIFRQNLLFLGGDANWQSIQFDFRRYFKVSPNSNNVLAFWSIAAFTSGNVPYLDLPSTGMDMYNNSGRGYALGRFRGKNMLYMESEYRFGISRNGLLGGVFFANAQSFTGLQSNDFQQIAPAFGTGLRIKINKHSGTNICIDYGVGTGGSHGFFVNLGEVF